MYNYEESDEYIDEEKHSRWPFIIIGFIVIIILLLIFVSCGMKNTDENKDKNNNLKYLKIENGTITPEFNRNEYAYSVSTESNSVKFMCEAESVKASIDGCNKEISIYNNSIKHIVRITSEKGNTKRYIFSISKMNKQPIDFKIEIDSIIASGVNTDKEVVLNARINTERENIKYEWYKNGIKLENEVSSSYVARESGTYYVRAITDDISASSDNFIVNIVKKEITKKPQDSQRNPSNNNYVLKIDSVTGNTSSWKNSVTLKVNSTSSNKLASSAYSFDGGKTYQKSNSKTFTSNGIINIVVKDSKGNTANKQVTISKVDNIIPTVNIRYTDKTNTSINLYATINPGNVVSGYKYQWYKNGNVIENATSLTYKASSEGNYMIKVITGSGNTASATYVYSPIKVACPKISVSNSYGNTIESEKWINDYAFVKIVPEEQTAKYDVYLNKSGNFDKLNKDFTYYDTFDSAVKVKLVNGGIRTLKIIVSDKMGNSTICYTKNYYLK